MPRLIVAADKFRGTLSAAEFGEAASAAAERAGWSVVVCPVADGGEGSVEALGGANKWTEVDGPLGQPVRAGWRLVRRVAHIEMAEASGLALIGGADGNDPLAASTIGTGQLLAKAVALGARHVIVHHGGSATTDGGLGALEALPSVARLREIDLTAAVDVDTRFVDAAAVFGPQKGATPGQVRLLTRRLERLVEDYRDRFGVDVSELIGAGAAGGLAGGLAAVGADIESGFDVIAEATGLDEAIEEGDLLVTGEGRLDATSFTGKVVGRIGERARLHGVPAVAVVGRSTLDPPDRPHDLEVLDLTARYGAERASAATARAVEDAILEVLTARS